MKKKVLSTLTTAAILAISITACGASNSGSTGTQSTSGLVVTQSASGNTGDSTLSASPIITPDVPSQSSGTGTTGTTESTEITEEQAKQIAFEHAQIQESDVTYQKIKKDYDDGISVYEIEFRAGNKEYEYDIKADDGQILKTDYEIDEDYVDPSTQVSVSEADARAAALARVEGAADSDIRKMELEKDDGRLVYEGKIIYNNTEYEFKIDATTGDFLKWEQDSVHS